MRYLILAVFLSNLVQVGIAQDTTATKPNSIFFEGLGIGMRYSINYESGAFKLKNQIGGFHYQGCIAPNFV
jgi:hypothetical protein